MKFKRVISFGDGHSDTGNLKKLVGEEFPDHIYPEGRFADGPVWTEYLAHGYNAQLLDYSCGFAQAKCQTLQIGKLKISVPGCLAQVGRFLHEERMEIDRESEGKHALVSFSFFESDFEEDDPELEQMFLIYETALLTLIQFTKCQHFFIPVMNNPNLLPKAEDKNHLEQSRIRIFSAKANIKWMQLIAKLTKAFPETIFYDYDFADFLHAAATKTSPFFSKRPINTCDTCLYFDKTTILSHMGDDFLFWDDLHFTSRGQRALAKSAISFINSKSLS